MVGTLRKILPCMCIVALLLTISSWASGYCLVNQDTVQVEQKGVISPTGGNEWPKFRHDLLNTGATNSPIPSNPYLVWTSNLKGMVTSSAAIVNGTIYVGSWGGSGVLGRLWAINLTTGGPIWEYKTGNLGIYSSPAVEGDKVYVGTREGNIVALQRSDGSVAWNFSTGAAVYASPAIDGGVVYVPSLDAKLYAIDATTGAQKWNTTLSASSDSSPAIVGGRIYLGDSVGKVYSIYPSNGTIDWSYDIQGEIASAPAISGNLLYINDFSKRAMVHAIYINNGSQAWEKNVTGSMKASPAIHDGKVYVATTNGMLWALNATTGAEVWSKLVSMKKIFSSPAVADGKIVFGDDDGVVHVQQESDGKEVWSYPLPTVIESSPAIYKGYMTFGANDDILYLLGYDTQPPKVTAIDPTNGAVGVPPDKKITITFSEQINVTKAINAFVISPSVGLTVSWDTDAKVATLNASMTTNTKYTVTAKGNVTDMHGNAMGSDFAFSFTTQDIIPPFVVSTDPANGKLEVPLNSKINITFSKPMQHSSSENAFTIVPDIIGKSFSWNASSTVMSVSSSVPLAADENYSVTISTNAADMIGNKMTAPYNFWFRSFDNVGPKVLGTSPKNKDINVPLTASVIITFHELVDELSANAGITFSPSIAFSATFAGPVMTIKPTAPLAGSTKYCVTVSDVKDLKGNTGGKYTFCFNTYDNVPPTIWSTDPTNGATKVKTKANMTIAFSEAMDTASVEGAITFYPKISSDPNVTFLPKWDNVSRVVTITPGAMLRECTKYYLNISTGAKDISGNKIASNYTLTFNTEGTCDGTHVVDGDCWWCPFAQYWLYILIIVFVVIMVLALLIPGRKTIMMAFGMTEEDLKEEGKKKEEEEKRCEICYGSLEDEPWITCKECEKPSHEKCIKKLGKCAYCKAPYSGAGEEKAPETEEKTPEPEEKAPEEKK